ncbi:hypothetical protein Bca4012_049066 [Brassica carinata]
MTSLLMTTLCVIKIVLQFCKENSLNQTFQTLQSECQIVLEMIELRELDTTRAILRQTQVMGVMKQEEQERYLRMEHLLVRSYFDPREVWELYYYWLFSVISHKHRLDMKLISF